MSSLHDSEVKALLDRYSVKPTKDRGQSFLTSQQVTHKILSSASLQSDDVVLEIGGGLGVLSKPIADQVHHLYVIEIDRGLFRALKDQMFGRSNVTLIQGDALHLDLPKANKIISNLPYSAASEITFRILQDYEFDLAVLMYQKEFAHRLLAKPGASEYSRLSIDFQYLGLAEHILDVKARDFYPRPKVDSSVLRIRKRVEGPSAKDDEIFFWLVHGIYSYPNKQLRKALKIWLKLIDSSRVATELIQRLEQDIEITTRLRSLTILDLVKIADTLHALVAEEKILGPRGE